MGKLWLRLLGIGEEEEADLSRRGFLKMLGGAAVVAAAPTYVFAPSGGWTPEPLYQFGFTGFKEMNTVTCDYIVPMLADNVFKPSPLFAKLGRTQIDTTKIFKQHRYRGFANV